MTKADNPQVTVPWIEWHNLNEQMKEAKRLFRRMLDLDTKGETLDREQIEGFLKSNDGDSRG